MPATGIGRVADSAAPGQAPQRRRELRAPLGQPDVVPDSLLAHLLAYLRGDDAGTGGPAGNAAHHPPAVWGGRRPPRGPGRRQGERRHLKAARGRRGARTQQWREWELELVHGSPGPVPGRGRDPGRRRREPGGARVQAGESPGEARLRRAPPDNGGQQPGAQGGREEGAGLRPPDRLPGRADQRNPGERSWRAAGGAGRRTRYALRHPPGTRSALAVYRRLLQGRDRSGGCATSSSGLAGCWDRRVTPK